MQRGLIIAIDGPSGVGKSTIARLIAKKLRFIYIDTGAIYRAITWKALENDINIQDSESLLQMIKNTKIEYKQTINREIHYKLYIDHEDVDQKIRDPRIDKYVSNIAKLSKIREELIELQRNLAVKGNIVMEGRDIGSKILKNADLKFYFVASEEERTHRRYVELKNKGFKIKYEEVKKQLINRDRIDSRRKFSPLKKAKDAVVIDSTNKNVYEVVAIILHYIKKYKKTGKL